MNARSNVCKRQEQCQEMDLQKQYGSPNAEEDASACLGLTQVISVAALKASCRIQIILRKAPSGSFSHGPFREEIPELLCSACAKMQPSLLSAEQS
jgi:hypothetical protein